MVISAVIFSNDTSQCCGYRDWLQRCLYMVEGSGVYAFSYYSAVSSQCYGYMEWLQCSQYRVEWNISVTPAFTAVLKHHRAVCTGTDCCDFIIG